MWIVRLALRRPYTFVVGALLLLLLTPLILWRTPTDIFPNINIPVLSVIWQYTGLSAQEMEQRIIYAHERVLTTTVDNIEHLESNSYNGVGVIRIFLHEGASVDAAIAQLTAVSQTILRLLPPGQTPPLIIRYNASTVPILQYSVTSPKMSEQELYDTAQNQVRVGLTTVQGAAIPWPYGGKSRVVAVDLNLEALKAKNLSPQDVVNAFNSQNLVLPGGTAKIGTREYNVELNSNPAALEELNDIPVKVVNQATIFLRDVAQVRDGYLPQQNIVRLDGVRGALLTILKNGTASTLDVVRGIKQLLPQVMSTLPPDLEAKEFADQSVFVRAAIHDVVKEGVAAAALTAVMLLLFLASWRSTFIIALSIPLSVLSSLAILSAIGETINLMTLGGLALAVGILVDDATVELENVHRQMAQGKPLQQAILDGAQEIALPAFVSTLCICIVFVPMFFLNGVARYLFVPLSEAVMFAMLASYAISRTLVPTLVMWLYRGVQHTPGQAGSIPGWIRPFASLQRAFENTFERFRARFRHLLSWCLHYRLRMAGAFLVFCAGSCLLIPELGENFFPAVDAGQFRLHVRAPTGTRIEETARLVDQIESEIRQELPEREVSGILDNIGIPNSGISLSYSSSGLFGAGDADILVSLKTGHAPTLDYVRGLRLHLNEKFPGTMFYFLPADIVSQTLGFGLPAPFDVQVVGRDQLNNRKIAARLAEQIRQVPGVVDVRIQQPNDQPKLQLAVDRSKAAELGLSEQDVANSALFSLTGSGQVLPAYWLNSRLGIQYLVNIRAPERDIQSLDTLLAVPVQAPNAGHGQILENLASVTRTESPPVFTHYNVAPVLDIYAGVDGRDLGGTLRDVQSLVGKARKELPRGSRIMLRGEAQTMQTSYRGLLLGLVVAVVLVYLVLVVNFQSWLDPFIIITALPGAVAGAVWSLFLLQTPLSVPALMGSIMSLGVATANSILVVSFAREKLRAGASPLQAALDAGTSRFRPVLMTALAMVLGMLPMSLGWGEGGEQNAPLGRAVIGGLLLATAATLFFVPVVFSVFHRSVSSPATPPRHNGSLESVRGNPILNGFTTSETYE